MNDPKKHIFDFLYEQSQLANNKNIVITGDLNTGKHFIDEKGKTFCCADYFDLFEQNGIIDAWRHVNGDKKEYSWYSYARNGFRLDHFLVGSNLKNKIIDCQYIHAYRLNQISDHSMMKLILR